MPKRNNTFKGSPAGFSGASVELDLGNVSPAGPSATPTIITGGNGEIKQSPSSVVSPTSSVPAPIQKRVLF